MIKFIEFVNTSNDELIIKLDDYCASFDCKTDTYYILNDEVTPKEYGRVRQLMIDYDYLQITKYNEPKEG